MFGTAETKPRQQPYWWTEQPPNPQEQKPIQFGGLEFSKLPFNDYGWYKINGEEFRGPEIGHISAPMMPMDEVIAWVEELTPTITDSLYVLDAKRRVMMGLIEAEKAKRGLQTQEVEQFSERRAFEQRMKELENELAYQKSLNAKGQQMKMKSNQEEQFQMMTEKASTDQTAADTHQIMLNMMERLAHDKPGDTVMQQMLRDASNSIQNQKQKAFARQEELASTRNLAERYENKLRRPQISRDPRYSQETVRKLEPHNILKAIKPFNPDHNPGTADFTDTWLYILSYTKSLGPLTENSYIDILLLVLQGQAHKIVYEMTMNRMDLDDILDTLSNLYCTKKTILDDMRDLNTFKRNSGEPIMRTMSRARLLVEKLKYLYPQGSWQDSCDRILMSLLKQVISKKTRMYIDIEEKKKLKLGIFLDYKACLDMVDTYETTHEEIPKQEVVTTVNACSGVPVSLDTNFTSEKDELKEKVTKLEQMFVNINALDPNDRRSVKERTRSASRERMRQKDRPQPKHFQNQMESFKKLQQEEKMEVDKRDQQRSRNPSYDKNNYQQSGYDRKRIYRDNKERDDKENKQYDKYAKSSHPALEYNRSRSYDNNRSQSYDNKRGQSVESYRSNQSRPGSSNSYYNNRNSSRDSNYRNSSRQGDYNRGNRSQSRESYYSRDRNNSRSRYDSRDRNYQSRDRNYSGQRRNQDNRSRPRERFNNSNNGNSRDRQRSPDRNRLNRNFSKDNFDRRNDQKQKQEGVVHNHYYVQCPHPKINSAQPESDQFPIPGQKAIEFIPSKN